MHLSFIPLILLLSSWVALCTPLLAYAQQTETSASLQINAQFPAGLLRDNLLNLATEQQLSIFFAEETLANLTVDAINETTTIATVLEKWLTVHCLEAEFIRARFVTISATSACGKPVEETIALAERPPAPPSTAIEEVLVTDRAQTGSRLRQLNLNQAMPVDVIDQQEIALLGLQTISELLRYVPAVSGNSTSTLISNGGDGSATITLRGLPASNTLVLLNGRRTNYNALSGDAVNLNTLPLSMVERIEILKDGVSAIYGADAVAGVVNIITKRDHEGLNAEIYQGMSGQGDLDTRQFSLHGSLNQGDWYASANLSAYQQDGIFSRDRARSDSSDDRSRGGINKRSSATVPAFVNVAGLPLRLSDGAAGTQPGDFEPVTSADRFEYRDFTSSVVPLDRYSLFTSIGYQQEQGWQFGLDAFYSRTIADTHFAPIPIFTGFENQPLTVGANHPSNPFGEPLFDVRRRVVELPARRQRNTTDSYHIVLHGEYEAEDYSVAAALQYNRALAEEQNKHGLRADRLAEALGDNCTAPCVPINILGAAGSITDDMLAYVGTGAQIDGTSILTGFTVDVDWQPSPRIALASGIEARRERLSVSPDSILSDGLYVAGGNRGATRGQRTVTEIYGELYFPFARSAGGDDQISMQLATRLSHYSDFGTVNNPRVVINWLPSKAWNVRLSWGKGFRAPTLPQLYSSNLRSFQQLNDPCSSTALLLPGCAQPSDPSLNQFLTVTGGNRELSPERSTTMSASIRWSKESTRSKQSLQLDAFAIDQRNVVDSSAQFIVNRNARDLAFGERIQRDLNGNLTRVLATLQNIGERKVKGLDLGAGLSFELSHSAQLELALNATRIISFKDKFDPDSPTVEKAGTFSDEASQGLGSLPDWKVSLAARGHYQHWLAHYSIYWISSLEEYVPFSARERTIDAWMTHNFNMSYYGPVTNWIRATVGIQNLFNAAPPFSAAAFNDSYDGRTYDITGRYFFVKLDRAF